MNNELVNKINYAYELCDELDGLDMALVTATNREILCV